MLIIPLKVPHRYELQAPLKAWLDQHSGSGSGPEFTSEECRDDLARLASLRRAVCNAITHPNGHAVAMEAVDDCHEYHAALLECESRGLTAQTQGDDGLRLEWDGAFAPSSDTFSSLLWERACLLWDLCAFETHAASIQNTSSGAGIKTSISHWNMAASLLKQLRAHVEKHNLQNTCVDLSTPMLLFWEKAMVAQAQMATYEFSLVKKARPAHAVLAKLAVGTVPVLNECLKLCQDPVLTSQLPQQTQSWGTHCKALSMWFKGKAEYDDSCAMRNRSQWGTELARLQRALVVITECQSFFQRLPSVPSSLLGFDTQVGQLRCTIQERIADAQADNNEIYHETIPADLRDIRGQLLVKAESEMPDTMSSPSVPMFRNLLQAGAKEVVQEFSREMEGLVYQMSNLVEQQTDGAKTELARVNLPHSLTAYRQELSGGGIPQDLWERVETIQRKERVKQLKGDLWTLRDVADAARNTANQIKQQLDEDLEMDRLFREQFPNFAGNNVEDLQREPRATLAGYESLLAKSQEGDSVLLQRLEVLDTDPKYKLLQFQKSQLDRLLPSASGSVPRVDTSRLSQLLGDLSELFDERVSLLKTLKDQVQNYNISSKLADVDDSGPSSDEQYQLVVRAARSAVHVIARDIQSNVKRQEALLDDILAENEQFKQARKSAGSSRNNDSCIGMIDDAIEDVEFFSKHLKEGHNFYSVVAPKLDQLKHQVGDMSVRLTVERCEHEEEARHGDSRRKQEMMDARMAQSLHNSGGGSSHSAGSDSAPPNGNRRDPDGRVHGDTRDILPIPSQPGVQNVLNDSTPEVRVDDNLLATLVSMDFDHDKAIEALRKYDNNIDQALNDLLQS